MKQFDIITIFPKILDSYFSESLFRRAQKNKLIKIKIHDLRQWTKDRHQTVDDRPYGGGFGLVFKFEPIFRALKAVAKKKKRRIVLTSPQGRKFDQKIAKRLSSYDQVIFICPRYEGVDARVEKLVDEKISLGDYVLSGGELAAAVMVETISRYIPGFVGKKESVADDSFSREGYLKYPQYTRPEVLVYKKKKLMAPKVLLSGNHEEVRKWREKQAKMR